MIKESDEENFFLPVFDNSIEERVHFLDPVNVSLHHLNTWHLQQHLAVLHQR